MLRPLNSWTGPAGNDQSDPMMSFMMIAARSKRKSRTERFEVPGFFMIYACPVEQRSTVLSRAMTPTVSGNSLVFD